MAPKKNQIKSLPRKGVSQKKAEAVKGGRKQEPRIALNHNLVVL
ncbi:MAG TPA: hypothetical protein VG817_06695 [Gemmatimonadales bacterium]|nr:hypothetical protein [Gemmatimonadales bacterium]